MGLILRNKGIVLDAALIDRLAKEQATSRAARAPRTTSATPVPPSRPAAPPRAPAAPARAGTLPPRLDRRAVEQRQAEARMRREHGSVDSLAASIAAKLG